MLGHKSIVVQLALVALLSHGFLLAGWTPVSHGAAPVAACGLGPVADTLSDGGTGDGDVVSGSDEAPSPCPFAGTPSADGPDNTIFFTPVLQDGDLDDDNDAQQVRLLRHAPRLPQSTI